MPGFGLMLNSTLPGLNASRRIALTAGALALSVPLIVGILKVPPVRAQSEPGPRPRFEVVSIKPCQPGGAPPGGGRGGGSATPGDPGLLRFTCVPVDRLIRFAYLQDASGKHEPGPSTFSRRIMNQNIAGEPGWAQSERYTIDALKVHQEDKEVPVYGLVIGRGGPKLTASKEDGCTPIELFDPMTRPSPGQRPPCGPFGPDAVGEIVTYASTLALLCAQFSAALDRDVVDKTGLTEKFDIHLQLTQQELFPWQGAHETAAAATAPEPSDPTSAIMAAVQKLGLRLEPATAPAQHLVIDRIERPSEN
jgi:hypothetical protein